MCFDFERSQAPGVPESAPAPEREKNKGMDKYHIYEEVGSGQHSQVFKGREKMDIEYVAIKRVEKSRMESVVKEVQVRVLQIQLVMMFLVQNHVQQYTSYIYVENPWGTSMIRVYSCTTDPGTYR